MINLFVRRFIKTVVASTPTPTPALIKAAELEKDFDSVKLRVREVIRAVVATKVIIALKIRILVVILVIDSSNAGPTSSIDLLLPLILVASTARLILSVGSPLIRLLRRE